MSDVQSIVESLRAELQAVEALFGVRITIIDFNGMFRRDGRHLLGHEQQSHKKNAVCGLGFCQKCIDHCRFDMNAVAQREQRSFVHHCWKGLCEVVTPIRWRGTHVGLLYAGIWRDPTADETVRSLRISDEFQNARNSLQALSDQKRDELMTALPLISDGLVSRLEVFLLGAPKHSRKDQIRLFLHRNFPTNVTLDDLADELSLSRFRASHVVRQLFGKSFRKLLIEARMEAAHALLLTSPIKVREVAQRVGIPNEYHFNRLFKRRFGLPPGQFRKQETG